MNLYFSKSYSDEEGIAESANLAMMFGTKEELMKVCSFFEKVKTHIKKNDSCHMHLCDNYLNWEKEKNFDIEVNLEKE